ncbi:peptide deformylase [Deltaproteobacteria bacterium OttesenSCG-928-M10]|nr:peptide deformylase [Deltaproteobacteria bacterium OttesenSCG-928-M10]
MMAILPILKYPDPRLREKCEPVTVFDDELKALAADMTETMLDAPGAGLAAPQVGRLVRMIVIAGAENDEEFDDRSLPLINPRLIWSAGEQVYDEGCLSVVDFNEKVIRAAEVEVEYQDLEGKPRRLAADGRRAVILQHEMDHLDGVLFIDHISQLKRDIYKRKLKKLQKESAND